MGRRIGSKDKKKRKPRSDRKHRYRKKHGKFVPYVPKRQKGDLIKIWYWRVDPMSQDGYFRFSRRIRSYMRKIVFRPLFRIDVDPSEISDSKGIADLSLEAVGYEGEFLFKGFSHGKNRFRVKPVTLARVRIFNTPEGLKCKVKPTFRLTRYWFWNKGVN